MCTGAGSAVGAPPPAPRAARRRRSDVPLLHAATFADSRDFAATYVRAGPRRRPHPRFLTERREAPPRTGEARPQGPDSDVGAMGARRSREATGRGGTGLALNGRGAPRTGVEAEGRQVGALPVASRLELGDLGEVTQTLRACFLFAKTAPVVEPTSQALLVGFVK